MMGRRSYVESFVSINQAVAKKTILKANKSEKVRALADDPQHCQGWLVVDANYRYTCIQRVN